MKCKLITEIVNGRTFIGGYYADPQGIDMPDKIANAIWRDQYGNYNWELLADGTVAQANLAPTAEQLAQKQDDDFIDRVAIQFFKIVKQAVLNTTGPAESWKAIDAALRDVLT
jgi:hypothetical protein